MMLKTNIMEVKELIKLLHIVMFEIRIGNEIVMVLINSYTGCLKDPRQPMSSTFYDSTSLHGNLNPLYYETAYIAKLWCLSL